MPALTLPADVSLKPETLAFLDKSPHKLLINGEWTIASGGTFETLNPATSEVLAQVGRGNTADVNAAVQAARAAFEGGDWPKLTGVARGELLWKLSDLIEQHADELAELETLDQGKPLKISRRVDVMQAVRHFRYYAGWASKIEGSTVPVNFPGNLVYTLREPMGVVGLIIPWNFPLLMSAWKLAPALATGNTCILKPAEQTPLTALRLGELILQAGFPAGVVNIVTGFGAEAGAAIAEHPDIDKVAFTGSTATGRRIMSAAASSNLKRVSLELGGKSPHVIFADADMATAIRGAVWGVFSTAGQECVAGSRLFVERPVYDQVVSGLAEQAAKIRVGNGFGTAHFGPIVSQGQLDRIMGFIERGKQGGAEVITGGERLGGDLAGGYFVGPTVFTHHDDAIELVREEIFGPVVAVTAFDDWDELLSRANMTRYGLAAGVWTRDIGKAHRFAQGVKAGTVWINQYGLIDAAAPFGGYRESGFGREMGKDAIELYTQVKTVWVGLG